MSIYYTGLFDNKLDVKQFESFRKKLNKEKFPDYTLLNNELEKSKLNTKIIKSDYWKWEYYPHKNLKELLEIDGAVCLNPYDDSIVLGKKSCLWQVPLRTEIFDQYENVRNELRKLFKNFAKKVNSNYAIYVPDNYFSISSAIDLVYENKSLDEIKFYLENEFGISKLKFVSKDELIEFINNSDENNWYFIDYFDDI